MFGRQLPHGRGIKAGKGTGARRVLCWCLGESVFFCFAEFFLSVNKSAVFVVVAVVNVGGVGDVVDADAYAAVDVIGFIFASFACPLLNGGVGLLVNVCLMLGTRCGVYPCACGGIADPLGL